MSIPLFSGIFQPLFIGILTPLLTPDGNEVHIIDIVYLCNDFSGELAKQVSEVSDLKWFKFDEIPKELSPPIKPILEKFCEERLSISQF